MAELFLEDTDSETAQVVLELDFSVSWSDAQEGPFVSAVVHLVRCDRSPSVSCQWVSA